MTRLDETLVATSDGEHSTPPHERFAKLERGTIVGRYVVFDRLGTGAMGVVYVAYDPELDRKVALKLLHGGTESGSGGRSHLLAEAQALAKIRDPNVVTVHDVGTMGEHVWIAMELVEGRTLSRWLVERPRTWREVLETTAPAARGLAAVHAAGLVHRDVKPDNVMVGDDGRVRVMDFGLARPHEHRESDPLAPDGVDPGPSRATSTGVVGTPAYMAPEQLAGGELGATADQFSFCVLLWEALYGERPFTGDTLVSLAVGMIGGQRRAPPRASGVPHWLRRVVARGLEAEPKRRWPSMEALLVELDRGHGRARLRRASAALGVVALVGIAGLVVHRVDVRRRVAACEAAGDEIAEVWNEGSRVRLHDALTATSASYAEDTARNVVPWIDARASAWRDARTQSCLAAHVDAKWDAQMLARSTWCLEERRVAIEVLVEELARADAIAMERAVDAAARLPLVEPCLDADQLVRMQDPPLDGRERAREIQAELARAEGLERMGHYAAAREIAAGARSRAEDLAWSPLLAAALVRESNAAKNTGDLEQAEAAAMRAYFTAAEVDAWSAAAAAATSLVDVVGARRARHAEGLVWGRHAEIALRHFGDPTELRTAALLNEIASVHRASGDLAEAKVLYERALAIREPVLGAEHPDVAATINNLANVHWGAGEYGEAKTLHERALALTERGQGSRHPGVGISLNNLGNVHRDMGDHATARALLQRALEILQEAHGPDHPDVATTLNNLANVEVSSGSVEAAVPLYERSLAVSERVLGPEHPDVSMGLTNLAAAKKLAGEPAQARALYQRALAIDEKVLGPDHPEVARTLLNLANVHREGGEVGRAREMYERAVAIDEKALGPDHPEVAGCLTHLAMADLDLKDVAAALPVAERAVAIFAGHEGDQPVEALARFTLARALVASGGDRRRAFALVEQAIATVRALGNPRDSQLVEMEGWLAEHRG